ncbi:MAG: hypothetical protein WC780_12430 [Lentimicrobiaceae bacterium]
MNFLLKLFAFVLIVIILDFSIGTVLKHYYFKQYSGYEFRTMYAMEETTADLLIFGSSKANHQYYPAIFENRLKLTYYNVGRDGTSIFYSYAILKSILKRYSPKMIILDITREFGKNQESYDRLSMLLPYYEKHPEIRSIIELKSKYEKLKLLSKIYPYNSLIFSIIAGNSEFNEERHRNINGYIPLFKELNPKSLIHSTPLHYDLDSVKIKIYESFIKDCIKSNIKLYIVISPDYINLEYNDKANIVAEKIAQKYNVKCFDFYRDTSLVNHAKYFADNSHLNDNGAKVFSKLVVDKIAQDYQKNNKSEN